MDTQRYLDRIGFALPVRVDYETLRQLAIAHQQTVPFENLDVHLGVPIVLDTDALFGKIVDRKRGGYCYELNSAFGALLRELGFSVDFIAARVVRPGSTGLPFDHLTLRVTIGDTPYLADVGFGDGFYEPMELRDGSTTKRFEREYRVAARGEQFVLEAQRGGKLDKGLEFALVPRALGEFSPMNRYHSSDPRSWWVRELVVTRATPSGRISLVGRRWTERTDGKSSREELGDSEYLERLRTEFGLDIRYVPRPKASRPGLRARRQLQIAVHRVRKLWSIVSGRSMES